MAVKKGEPRGHVVVRTARLWRDVEGYEIRDHGPAPSGGLAYYGNFGLHIVGRSGRVVPAVYEADGELWRQAVRQIVDLEGLCTFMSKYGPIGNDAVLRDDDTSLQLKFFQPGSQYEQKFGSFWVQLARPQSLSESTGLQFVNTIRLLADYVDRMDASGFLSALGGALAPRVSLRPDLGDRPWAIELPSLLSLLKYEMWNTFGSDRQARSSLRSCENCASSMHVGGRRGASLRADARYCSKSCRQAANLRRKRSVAEREPTP